MPLFKDSTIPLSLPSVRDGNGQAIDGTLLCQRWGVSVQSSPYGAVASWAAIREAYKRLALAVHPDKNASGDDAAFKALSEEFACFKQLFNAPMDCVKVRTTDASAAKLAKSTKWASIIAEEEAKTARIEAKLAEITRQLTIKRQRNAARRRRIEAFEREVIAKNQETLEQEQLAAAKRQEALEKQRLAAAKRQEALEKQQLAATKRQEALEKQQLAAAKRREAAQINQETEALKQQLAADEAFNAHMCVFDALLEEDYSY